MIHMLHKSKLHPNAIITPNFMWGEYWCRCDKCDMFLLDNRLFNMLERLRAGLDDTPMRITSGYRCPTHNANVGGASRSKHMEGIAVDIQSADGNINPVQIGNMAKHLGFNGIKVYKTWTHLDLREGGVWHVGV